MKIKTIVVASLLLAFGLLVWAPVQAQRPAGKRPGKAPGAATPIKKPNAVALKTAAQDTEPDVVRLLPQNLPQTPLRVGIHNAIQKGMQEAKPNPAATLTLHNATGNAAQNALPSAVPNAPSNTVPPVPRDIMPNANAKQPTQTTRTLAVPPEFQAGITALESAQSSLLSAGQKWGGHKMKAAGFINQALAACGQPKILLREADVASADQSAAMQTALTQLTNAKNAFANATNAWDGRCDQAIALMNQALTEVQAAINFAKNHKTY